jgi:rRNA maturation protein Nop10
VAIGQRGFEVGSLDELYRVATAASKSKLCPEAFRGKPEDCFMAMEIGRELGLREFTSLQNMYVVKGKVSMPGQVMAALIRSNPQCEEYILECRGEGELRYGYVRSIRRGQKPVETTFTLDQAKDAKLYPGDVWSKYTADMLIWKAVARDGKRNWSDVLLGIECYEDMGGRVTDDGAPAVQVVEATVAPAEPDPARAMLSGGASPASTHNPQAEPAGEAPSTEVREGAAEQPESRPAEPASEEVAPSVPAEPAAPDPRDAHKGPPCAECGVRGAHDYRCPQMKVEQAEGVTLDVCPECGEIVGTPHGEECSLQGGETPPTDEELAQLDRDAQPAETVIKNEALTSFDGDAPPAQTVDEKGEPEDAPSPLCPECERHVPEFGHHPDCTAR